MKKLFILILFVNFVFISCGDDSENGTVLSRPNNCANVTCSGHGKCFLNNGQAFCDCEDGYEAEGIECKLKSASDLCADIDCSGHGKCFIDDGYAMCECDDGYVREDFYYCEKIEEDPCVNVGCSYRGTCRNDNGKAVCDCDDGYKAEGLECINTDLCADKICDHGTCNPDTGKCDCEEGWSGDECSSFDNGGPWKVKVTGDVNEEIELNYIHCSYRDLSKEMIISFFSSKYASAPRIITRLKGENIVAGRKYSSQNNDIYSTVETANNSNIFSSLSGNNNVEIILNKYNPYISLGGSLKINGNCNDSNNNSLTLSPNIFNFKCGCIENADTSEKECYLH